MSRRKIFGTDGAAAIVSGRLAVSLTGPHHLYIASYRPRAASGCEIAGGHIQFLISVVGDIEVSKFDQAMLRKYRESLNKPTAKRSGEVVAIKNLIKNEHLERCANVSEA